MVPETDIELDYLEGIEEEAEMPSFDFKLNTETNRLSGNVEDLEAVKQAIFLILSTERGEHAIYPEDYGVEFNDLIGQDVEWVIPELEMRIKEALMMDERITEATDFAFDTSTKGVITVTFSVESTKGTITVEKEVPV
ncbi:MAG: DUF2634 domain-containing protein [Lachnospiraceae bacterium]|nr:DUF2634 domain-containing protein [Lachnospiraceae bacterium]